MIHDFTFSEFTQWIDAIDQRLRDATSSDDQTKRILTRALKVSEECGELSDAVLSSLKDQRADKLAGKDIMEHLGQEMADVIITTALLARAYDIDLEESLRKKMAMIDTRNFSRH